MKNGLTYISFMDTELTAKAYQELLDALDQKNTQDMVNAIKESSPELAESIQGTKTRQAKGIINKRISDFASFMTYDYVNLRDEDKSFLLILETQKNIRIQRKMAESINSIRVWVVLFGVLYIIGLLLILFGLA